MSLPAPRKDRTVIITCSDHRTVPEKFLKLEQDDAVLISRNPGGHVAPNITGLLAFDSFVTIANLLIVHHTDCGTTHFSEDVIRAELKKRVPDRAAEIDAMYLGQIRDMEQSVRDDLAYLHASPFVRQELKDCARGFVYDLKTGLLTAVEG
ncbi:carbonic anhydrase [Rhizodiscina lignyota]|uniref:Carbonic anhydrase n=1 Tax=Rhizodiscina lignyota TaxID=1504668 RepID=A0A9P4ICY1_9PEZI|nr:carbonic anhydrase [Rhizodiscina lignyota]